MRAREPSNDQIQVVDNRPRPRRHLLTQSPRQEPELAPGFRVEPIYLDPRHAASAKQFVRRQKRDQRLAGARHAHEAYDECLFVEDEFSRTGLFHIAWPEALTIPPSNAAQITDAVVLLIDAPRGLAVPVHPELTTLVGDEGGHIGDVRQL